MIALKQIYPNGSFYHVFNEDIKIGEMVKRTLDGEVSFFARLATKTTRLLWQGPFKTQDEALKAANLLETISSKIYADPRAHLQNPDVQKALLNYRSKTKGSNEAKEALSLYRSVARQIKHKGTIK